MKQCKCEHWQICPTCKPNRFGADGNLLPPEPTPLQAARAQIEQDEALLRQALEALENVQEVCTEDEHGRVEAATVWTPEIIAALRERLDASLKPGEGK